ncbi:transporter substrate-binding domain-containing protein [Neiella marina]|uniref:Transporter substrate-binding domain-containing protein n=1 Tax=Neiella holothuriorum TaxID=2870530 RepID=A0ABS7EAY3_9GAMM|nr:transporter substrate-binding domain-containing protein [Neiella holothuriorum]MBW8189504.1 transporter substrate-binding domain-containing protein [Neiella holothuriorum]
MKNLMKTLLSILVVMPTLSFAVDTVKWPSSELKNDPRGAYKRAVIETALQKTEATHGPYAIEEAVFASKFSTYRAREMVIEGSDINTYIALTNDDWERLTLPIRIPIRRGIINYRLLMIHRDNVNKFQHIENLHQLKNTVVGLQLGWTTTEILDAGGFDIELSSKYSSLFPMLDGKRFDYVPRGVNEIFNEQARYGRDLDIVVEPTIALYVPSPTYIFISPKEPALAARIEQGLEIMVADGTLKKMFYERFSEGLKLADIASRKLIKIPNPLLPAATPLDRPELWYQAGESVN